MSKISKIIFIQFLKIKYEFLGQWISYHDTGSCSCVVGDSHRFMSLYSFWSIFVFGKFYDIHVSFCSFPRVKPKCLIFAEIHWDRNIWHSSNNAKEHNWQSQFHIFQIHCNHCTMCIRATKSAELDVWILSIFH